jgi:hypothetical protein
MNDGCDDAGWLAAAVELADRHDAARGGFDDREFYELFARDHSTLAHPGRDRARARRHVAVRRSARPRRARRLQAP